MLPKNGHQKDDQTEHKNVKQQSIQNHAEKYPVVHLSPDFRLLLNIIGIGVDVKVRLAFVSISQKIDQISPHTIFPHFMLLSSSDDVSIGVAVVDVLVVDNGWFFHDGPVFVSGRET